MTNGLLLLQEQLGYRFADASLCTRALTHRSYGATHNERLEFLGDAALDLVVADVLHERFPDAPEGDLSHMRSAVVCSESLVAIAQHLQLGTLLLMGEGELRSGGRERVSNLANAVEALLAAVYLDGGFDACKRVTLTLFAPVLATLTPGVGKEAKTRLQEYLQAHRWPLPCYRVVSRTGKEHQAMFTVCCEVQQPAFMQASATAASRKKAEQLAAASLLSRLESADGC